MPELDVRPRRRPYTMTKQLVASLPEDLLDRIDGFADERTCSRAAAARRLIEAGLAAHDAGDPV